MSESKFVLVAALFAGTAALSGAAAARPARGMPRAAIDSPVVVDVSRLRALGLGPTADLVQSTIASELRGHAPAGTRLVIRVNALSMGFYAGGDSGGGGGGGGGTGGSGGGGVGTDSMEGVGLIVGPGGEIRASYPIVLSLPTDSAGAYYLPDNEQRRVVVLSQNFVRWIERRLG